MALRCPAWPWAEGMTAHPAAHGRLPLASVPASVCREEEGQETQSPGSRAWGQEDSLLSSCCGQLSAPAGLGRSAHLSHWADCAWSLAPPNFYFLIDNNDVNNNTSHCAIYSWLRSWEAGFSVGEEVRPRGDTCLTQASSR